MKYRHSFHAGNFADVHKHVTLLQLLTALKKKDKGFLYLDTHAGRGSYDLSSPSAEAAAGIGRFASLEPSAPELRQYAALLTQFRARRGRRRLRPADPRGGGARRRGAFREPRAQRAGVAPVRRAAHAVSRPPRAAASVPGLAADRGE